MPDDVHIWQFHDGSMDGLTLSVPMGILLPSEIVFRDAYSHPPGETIYRCCPAAPVLSVESLLYPRDHFVVAETSEFAEVLRGLEHQRRNSDEELFKLQARIARQAIQINRLRGTIQAMKTRRTKRA
jgi:hypothetical protein